MLLAYPMALLDLWLKKEKKAKIRKLGQDLKIYKAIMKKGPPKEWPKIITPLAEEVAKRAFRLEPKGKKLARNKIKVKYSRLTWRQRIKL